MVDRTNLPAVVVEGQPGRLADSGAVNRAVNALTAASPLDHTWETGALPHVTITTAAGAPVNSTEVYVAATITINGPAPYSGTLQIKGRGNTTWTAPKKPYRLKLTNTATLLGMPTEKDWVLLANYYDPTAIRTAVAFELGARSSGLTWTPRMRYVELTLNGTYMGLYQLGEQVEFSSPNKIAATKASGTAGLPLTGSYSLEIDQRLESGTDIGFRTTLTNLPIVMDDPDGTTPAHKAYIQQWMNDFEAALYGPAWLDPATGYARFIDRDSFIDWYLVNELLKNVDSNFFSSCKLVKSADTAAAPGLLHMGPLWDFDRSLGWNNIDPYGWWTRTSTEASHPGAIWVDRMMGDPTFWAALTTRWAALRTTMTTGDTMAAYVDRLTDRLTYANARDRRTWAYTADTPALGDAAKAWLTTRTAWLTSQFAPESVAPTIPGSPAAIGQDTQATLVWTASTDNVFVVKYRVRRGGVLIAEPYTPGYVDTGLTNGTAYDYTITAVDPSANESAQTAILTAVPAPPGADATPPSVPTGLAATAANTAVGLTWAASSDNVAVAGYRVRRDGAVVGSPTATTFSDTGLVNGTTYSYTVTGVDANGNESAETAPVTAVPAAAPAGVASESWTGADGAGWPAGWTTYRGATIVGNRGRLTASPSSQISPTWWSTMPPVTSFDLQVTVTLQTANGSVRVGVSAAATDDSEPRDGNVLRLGINAGQVQELVLRNSVAGNGSEVAYVSISGSPVTPSATGLRVRVQRTGSTFRAKVWPDGTAEPTGWSITGTITAPTGTITDRAFLSYANNVVSSVDFDNLVFV